MCVCVRESILKVFSNNDNNNNNSYIALYPKMSSPHFTDHYEMRKQPFAFDCRVELLLWGGRVLRWAILSQRWPEKKGGGGGKRKKKKTWSRWASQPTDYGTWQHAIFILLCCFDHLMTGVNVKYIYELVGGTQLIVRSHQSKIHESTVLRWQDAHFR